MNPYAVLLALTGIGLLVACVHIVVREHNERWAPHLGQLADEALAPSADVVDVWSDCPIWSETVRDMPEASALAVQFAVDVESFVRRNGATS